MVGSHRLDFMNSSSNVMVEPPARPSAAVPPLTSWYAEGRSDALGDRLLMFDNATSANFELLRFRPEVADVPGFEQALRSRVGRLEPFRHKAFATVMAVEHLEGGGGLTLVSTHIPGKRLSEMIQAPRLVGLHPAFATWIIQQLTPALAELQRQGGDMAHGALTADRIVLTPDGSFVMVEHVLAGAVERLRLPPIRLWSEYGIASPSMDAGFAHLDGRADVIQLALIVLSVLLGRRVAPSQFPDGLGLLLDECTDADGPQRSPSVITLRRWLERALGLRGKPFRSAEEARLGLNELPNSKSAAALGAPGASAPRGRAALSSPAPPSKGEDTNMKNRAMHLIEPRTSSAAAPGGAQGGETARMPASGVSRLRRRVAPALAACLGVVALAEAGAIAQLMMTRQVVAPATRVPVLIDSPESGDFVMVDGRQVGTTPLNVIVGADTHAIRVARQVPAAPALPAAGSEARVQQTPVEQKTAASLALAAARQRSGGLRLSSPIELKVLEGDRVLGSTADGLIVTTAGEHQLDLINTALGYRGHQTVVIRAGQIASLVVTPPNGKVSINASPWAQVWIDGRPLGETPIANVSIPLGEHEITFRHPQLGEKRESVVVRADASTRVSTSLGR